MDAYYKLVSWTKSYPWDGAYWLEIISFFCESTYDLQLISATRGKDLVHKTITDPWVGHKIEPFTIKLHFVA